MTVGGSLLRCGRSHPGLQKLARRLAELIPSAELIEVPPATHAVQQFTEHFHPALLAVTAGGDGK